MRDFEIVWLQDFDLGDLSLSKKRGDRAYVSEDEALRSKDFKRAKQVGAIQVNPFESAKKVITKSQVSPSLDPILDNQKRMISLLEELVSLGGVPSTFPRIAEKSPSKQYEPDFVMPKIEFHETKFGNEIRHEQTESTEVQDSLKKLKSLRKGKP